MDKKAFLIFPILLVTYETAAYLSNDLYLPALPQIMEDFGINDSIAQLTLTAWFLGAASIQLILAPISDRFGRRPVLIIGCVIFIISCVICAVTTDIYVFLLARFLQGSAVCSVTVAGYASIHELYDTKRAISILAWMASITVLAPAFGPLLGGIAMLHFEWRFLFEFLAVWVFIMFILLFKLMPESLRPEDVHKIHLVKLMQSYWRLIKNPGYILNSLTMGIIIGGNIAWIAAGPFLVMQTFEHNVIWFGVSQACIFGTLIVTARLIKPLMERFAVANIIKSGISIACTGAALQIITGFFIPENLYLFIIATMCYAAGTGLSFAPLQRVAVEFSDEPMGARMAVLSTLGALAASFASIMVSVFYNETSLSLGIIMAAFAFIALFCQVILYFKNK